MGIFIIAAVKWCQDFNFLYSPHLVRPQKFINTHKLLLYTEIFSKRRKIFSRVVEEPELTNLGIEGLVNRT